MSTKSKNAVVIVVAAVVAYALGAIIGFPPVANDLSKGDIAKVSRYSRSVVSPTLSLVQEKLQADSIYRKQTLDMFSVVSARLSGFESLCELSTQATEGLGEFDAINAKLQANIPTAKNAALRGEEMVQALNDLVAGKKVNDFEQLSNNIVISYLIIDKEVSLGKTFVELADSQLEKENNDKLAFVRDMWMDYCAIDAVLNGDQAETEYWAKKDYVLTPEQMSNHYQVGNSLEMKVQNASNMSVNWMSPAGNSSQFATQNSSQFATQNGSQFATQNGSQFATQNGSQFATQNGSQFATQNSGQFATQNVGQFAAQLKAKQVTANSDQFAAQNGSQFSQGNVFQTLNGGLNQFSQNFTTSEQQLGPVSGSASERPVVSK